MKSETPARPRAAKSPRRRETQLRGIAVSPGIAIGPAFDTSEAPAEAPRRRITTEAIEAERLRLADAVAFSRKQVTKLKTRIAILPEEAQEEIAPLLDAHLLMLGNSRLIRGARKRIEGELLAAETAITDEGKRLRKRSLPQRMMTAPASRAVPRKCVTLRGASRAT